MERGRHDVVAEDGRKSSPSKDDSLTDFKSPKADDVAKPSGKLKISNEKRSKKPSSKGKSSASGRKKEVGASERQLRSEKAQPSIESSFFKAGNTGKREGHTCPLCMRYFEDVYAGTGHTKSCAAKNKVSTTKLLAAVALQERQADERLAIGLPAGPLVQSRDKTPRRNRGACSLHHFRDKWTRLTRVWSQYASAIKTLKGDSDLQLALALSKSLQENQAERELEEALLLAAEHRGDAPMPGMTDSQRRSTLKNFGFLTNKPVSDAPIKTRRKKHLGPTILQTRTQESRDRLLTERIAEILMGNEAITQVSRHEPIAEVNSVEKPPVALKSRLLNEIHRTTERLWDSAQLSKAVTKFYVEELGAVVVPVVEPRQQAEPVTLSQTNTDREADSPDFSNECEIEASNKDSKMPRSPNNATDRVESPRNVYITDRQYRNSLTMDWSNTLNVSTMSDVVVLVDKNHIWAHKLVFHVRCSDILLDCQPIDDKRFRHVREKISWPDIDYLTALAFLEFVYSGVIVKNEHVFSDDRIAALVRNLARKYRLKDLFEYMRKRKSEIDARSEELEGRKSGLRSPIVIEVSRRDREARTVPDESARAVEKEEMSKPSTSSLGRKSCIVDLTDAKTPDIDVQSIEDDVLTIDTEPTGDRGNRSITSPDIFDDTTEEAMDDAETNSPEAAEASARVSTNENSNLRVLAELIAEDDFSRSDEANDTDASSTASTFVDDGLSEESTAAKRTDKQSSPSQRQSETPTTRGSSIANKSKIINARKKSMTKRLPEKPKSNLSIFIEKVQKINEKSCRVSYTEEESLGEPYDRGRLRNPFNVNNESNRSVSDDEGKTEGGLLMDGKGALSALEEDLLLRHGKKDSNVDLRSANESAGFDEPFSMGNFDLEEKTEDAQLMGENGADRILEEEPLFNHGKNDKKVDLKSADESARFNDSSSMVNLDLEDSTILENAASTDDENMSMYSRYKRTHKHNNSINKYRSLLIKLTEASAAASEDDDKRNGLSPRVDEAIDLTQESDSEIESSPSFNVVRSKKRNSVRAIDSDSNESSNSRGNDGRKDKSFAAGNKNDLDVSSDDAADGSFDDAESPTPVSKQSIGRAKRMNNTSPMANSFDRKKNLSTSLEYPDPPVREASEEIFTQSLKRRRTLTPSPRLSADSPEKSVSERCKRRSKEGRSKEPSFEDNFEENEKLHRADRSSRDADSSSEVDEEIFTQSLKIRRSLTPSPRLSTDAAEKSISARSKRRSDEGVSKDPNVVHNLKKSEESQRANRSSKGKEVTSHSSQYPDLDVFEVDEDLFAESFGCPRRSPSPRSKFESSSRKRRMGDGGAEDIVDVPEMHNEEEKEEEEASSSRGRKKRRSSPHYSDFDVFEVNDQVFTQSFRSPSVSPREALTRSPGFGAADDDQRGRNGMLRVPSPIIVISSSPEMDLHSDGPTKNTEDSNKENSFLPVEDNSGSLYSGRNSWSVSNLNEPSSPKPGPSRRGFSPECGGISATPARKSFQRWNSMPTSTTSTQRLKRTRSPKKSSRVALSQGVTPPVNYDAMDTPELKRELEKYGIKPQKAHRARQLLTHIYNELHSEVATAASDGDEEPPVKKIGRTDNQSSEDSDSESVDGAVSVIPEEMEFDDADVPSNGKDDASNKSSVKQAFTALVKQDKELYNKILTYEPLPLELLHMMLKARGFKCKLNDLMDFLDEECITFQVQDQSRRKKGNRERGKKTATTGTRRPKSQKN